ncbi:hypothetical protein [Orlajensenia leifsoniae]|uniref:Inhibitor I9 domain-containing protein n=1 Tax=Orlajensenia leifsoniae TaxID=2561933 RepID=A0A4Y9R5V4_9MICO|nr:hypothetical protein [Leifsonia flava]TFV99677.1 hypothetical protein E4M00_00260 [Leifsonia flava]
MKRTTHRSLITIGTMTAVAAAIVAATPLSATAAVRDPKAPVIVLVRIDDSAQVRQVTTAQQSPRLTRIGDQLVRGDNLTGAPSAAYLNRIAAVHHSADVHERLATGQKTVAPTAEHHSADVHERLATNESRLPKPDAPR